MATEKKKKSALQDMAGTAATAIVLMIVLSIFVFPNFYGDKGAKTVKKEMEAIAAAFESYRSENGSLPTGTLSQISEAIRKSHPDLERTDKDGRLLDPWDKPYQIFSSNDGFVIRSAGHNGEFDKGSPKDGDDIYFGSR